MKTLIIYHKSDYDGVASGLIFKKYVEETWHESPKLYGWNYGEPVSAEIYQYDLILIGDITLPTDVMLKIKNKTTWIDHHITSIQESEKSGFSDIPGLRDSSKAACELVWNFCYPNQDTPYFIQLLGAFDIFDRERFDWEGIVTPLQLVLRASYGMSLIDIWPDFNDLLGSTAYLGELLEKGKLISKYQKQISDSAVKNYSFEVCVAGRYKGIAMLSTTFGSIQFGELLKQYDFSVVANRRANGDYGLSMYKEPGVLPEFNNGEYLKSKFSIAGGHANAAGATLNEAEFINFLTKREI